MEERGKIMGDMREDIIAEEKEVAVVSKKQLEVVREVLPMKELMEMATMLAKSTIVPAQYMNRPENIFVALDMASRMGLSVMVVMQNLYIIQGKPSWSGQAIASMILSNPKFKNVEVNFIGTEGKDDWGAFVTAENVHSGKVIKGATVTIAIAKKEAWYQKSGSKWQTTPELMLSYRAYTWFGRVYCPEIMMGLQSVDEVEDVGYTKVKAENPFDESEVK
jgi:hypothetical protein